MDEYIPDKENSEGGIKVGERLLDILFFILIPILAFSLASDPFFLVDHKRENAHMGLLISPEYSWPLIPLFIWALWSYFQKSVPKSRIGQFFHFGGLVSGLLYGFSQVLFFTAGPPMDMVFAVAFELIFALPLMGIYWFFVSGIREGRTRFGLKGWGIFVGLIALGILTLREAMLALIGFPLFITLLIYPGFFTINMLFRLWVDARHENTLDLSKNAPAGVAPAVMTVLGWQASLWLALDAYKALPKDPPSCYIATAAAKGHASVVGSKTLQLQNGNLFYCNSQLRLGKLFEIYVKVRLPRCYALLRRFYDFVGPKIASRLNTPVKADMAWVALLPLEFLARIVLHLTLPHYKRYENALWNEGRHG